MTNENKNRELYVHRHFRIGVRSAFGVLAFAASFPIAAYAATEFHPTAEVSASWTDNIKLVGEDDPAKESIYFLQVNPGFSWQQRAERINSSLLYTAQNLFYPSDSDRNSTYHQGAATANAEFIKDFFFVEATGTYSQQLIDPSLPTNTSNLFDVNSQADALAAQLTPILRHEFSAFYFDARYSAGIVDYKTDASTTSAVQDSEVRSASAELGSVGDDPRVSWLARYDSQRSEYDLAQPFRFDRAFAELGFLIGNDFRLIGRGGKESDPTIDPTAGGLDQSTWEAGFRWRPARRTSIEAFYGDRFYGHSYSARISHEARRVILAANYTEGPSTQAQETIARPVVTIDPLQNSAPPLGSDFSRLVPDVFVRKEVGASMRIIGQRTEIELAANEHRREYITGAPGTEHNRNGRLSISRNLSARGRLTVSGIVNDADLRDGTSSRETDFRVDASRQLSKHVSMTLGGFQKRRTGNLEYKAHVVTLSVVGEY